MTRTRSWRHYRSPRLRHGRRDRPGPSTSLRVFLEFERAAAIGGRTLQRLTVLGNGQGDLVVMGALRRHLLELLYVHAHRLLDLKVDGLVLERPFAAHGHDHAHLEGLVLLQLERN